MSPVSDDEKFRIASAPGDVKPARELYKELLELMRKIAAEGRADERTAKRMEHLAVVRYTAPGPAPGVTVSVRMDLNDPYVMEPPEAFEALMIKAIEIAFPRDMETAMMLVGAIPVLRAEALHENDALPPNERLTLDPWS